MADVINIQSKIREIEFHVNNVREATKKAMPQALNVVWMNVVDLTPRGLTNELAGSIKKEVLDDGLTGRVYSTGGVVAKVMEGRPKAMWSKKPPFKPIHQWVMGKLGLTGDEAVTVAHKIRAKIKKRGITIPLKHDQRGGMFHRTVEKARKTKFHMVAFVSALKRLAASQSAAGGEVQPELF